MNEYDFIFYLSCGFARLVYILRVSRLELDQTMLFGAVLKNMNMI